MEPAEMKSRPLLNRWLNEIQKIIQQDNYSLTQLAVELKRDLAQVHRWLVTKSVEPGGEATIQLIQWAIKRRANLLCDRDYFPQPKNLRVNRSGEPQKRLTSKHHR